MAVKNRSSLPPVDVIIPTYNGLPYLRETVKSVLTQTHKNFILYVIDDGSTDNGATKKYIDSLKDKRIKYYHKKNGGQATARNYGIKISKSSYIAFVDSDDIWLPKKLEMQLQLFGRQPENGLVYGYHYILNEHGKIANEVTHKREGHLFKYLLSGNKISGSASMVMVRRAVFDDVGLFHEDFLIGEDWEMWLRIAEKYRIGCVHEYLAELRALPEGMQKNYLKMAKGLEYMLPILVNEFKPGVVGRAKLYGTCLWDAANYYYMAGDYDNAQRVFRKLIRYNPSKLKLNRNYWYMYIRLGLRTEVVRQMRRRLSKGYRQREVEHLKKSSKLSK